MGRGWIIGGAAAAIGVAGILYLTGILPFISRKHDDNLASYGIAQVHMTGDLLSQLELTVDSNQIKGIEFDDAKNEIRYIDSDGTQRTFQMSEEGIDRRLGILPDLTDQSHVFYDTEALKELKDRGRLDDLAYIIAGGGLYPTVLLGSASRETVSDSLTQGEVEKMLSRAVRVTWGAPISTAFGPTIVFSDGAAVEAVYLDSQGGAIAQQKLFPKYLGLGR